MAGRRTKLTPGLQAELCDLLKVGNYIEAACGCVGIGVSTYHNWITRGQVESQRVAANPRARTTKREAPFVDFMEATARARAEAEREAVAVVMAAASKGTWEAAKWYLERSFPDRWGKRTQRFEVDAPSVFVFVPQLEDEP